MKVFTPNTVINSVDVNANFDELKVKTDYLSTPDTTWHEIGAGGEPAFQNSWVNYGDPYNTAAFRKDAFGYVHIKGFIKTGASASIAFTLPAGYRPLKTYWFPSMGNDVIGKILINSSGHVLPYGTGVSSWVTLDGITFKAEA